VSGFVFVVRSWRRPLAPTRLPRAGSPNRQSTYSARRRTE